jgi:hypothetical protein
MSSSTSPGSGVYHRSGAEDEASLDGRARSLIGRDCRTSPPKNGFGLRGRAGGGGMSMARIIGLSSGTECCVSELDLGGDWIRLNGSLALTRSLFDGDFSPSPSTSSPACEDRRRRCSFRGRCTGGGSSWCCESSLADVE